MEWNDSILLGKKSSRLKSTFVNGIYTATLRNARNHKTVKRKRWCKFVQKGASPLFHFKTIKRVLFRIHPTRLSLRDKRDNVLIRAIDPQCSFSYVQTEIKLGHGVFATLGGRGGSLSWARAILCGKMTRNVLKKKKKKRSSFRDRNGDRLRLLPRRVIREISKFEIKWNEILFYFYFDINNLKIAV